ncbi:MAG: ABC transporter ATP-binding protein/permease [Mycoplasma sp.]
MIDKKLFELIGKNKIYIFISVILMLFSLIFSIGITISICWMISNSIMSFSFNEYIAPIILISVTLPLKFFIIKSITIVKNKLAEKIKKDLRVRMYKKICDIGWDNEDKVLSKSGLMQLSAEGIEQLELYYSIYLPQLFYSLTSPIVLFLLTVFISWQVSLLLLFCVPLIPISIMFISKYAKKIFSKYWDKYISLGDKFLDNLQGLKDLKILDADNIQQEKMDNESEEFRKITMKVLIMQLTSVTIMDLVAYGGSALGIMLVIFGLINNDLNQINGLFLILIAIEFFIPLRMLGSNFHIAMNGATAGRKIIDLIALKSPIWGNEHIVDTNLMLKSASFLYHGMNILSDINLSFSTNQLTAIVGESGSGKTTIASILSGLIRIDNGHFLIGGKSIQQINKENFYNNVSLVSYDSFLFNESIRENFKMANKDITDEEIWTSLKEMNLYNFVKRNGGLDYKILEEASNLSGGQKQRMSLAVSLSKKKSIYIFDEITSNIDLYSENIIMNKIYGLKKESTVILISHRLSNITNADNIYFLSKGQVLEFGKHSKLMSDDKKYKNFFNKQQELENLVDFKFGASTYE